MRRSALLPSRFDLESIDAKLAVIQAYQTGIYVVRAGDTATKVGQLFDIKSADLERLNSGVKWNRLRVGQRIKVRINLPDTIGPPEPPLPDSSSSAPSHRTLDSLPASSSGGGQ